MKQFINTLLTFIGLLPILVLDSCKKKSTDIDQDKIWAHYEIYYDQNQDVTWARTKFKFGNALGSAIQLTAPATITFNGSALIYQSSTEQYEKVFQGFVSGGTFTYADKNNTIYSNSISYIKPIGFPAIDTIHKTNSYTLTWIGDSLATNESVNLWLSGSNYHTEFFYQNKLNSKSIICAANQLQKLSNLNTSGAMLRIYAPPIQQSTGAGGEINGKFLAHNLNTVIAD